MISFLILIIGMTLSQIKFDKKDILTNSGERKSFCNIFIIYRIFPPIPYELGGQKTSEVQISNKGAKRMTKFIRIKFCMMRTIYLQLTPLLQNEETII